MIASGPVMMPSEQHTMEEMPKTIDAIANPLIEFEGATGKTTDWTGIGGGVSLMKGSVQFALSHPLIFDPMLLHLAYQNKPYGPYSLDAVNAELLAKRLAAKDTLAWHEGMTDWVPLAQIPGIRVPAELETGDATGGLIPYKNPMALASYYTGIGALIPLLGIVAGIISIVLGIKGLKHYRAHPATRGVVHAWIGIILSSLSLLVHGLVVVALVMAGLPR